MPFAFDFCLAAFGADDRLSVMLLDTSTGATTVITCSAIVAASLLDEVGSVLMARVFDESEEPWYS